MKNEWKHRNPLRRKCSQRFISDAFCKVSKNRDHQSVELLFKVEAILSLFFVLVPLRQHALRGWLFINEAFPVGAVAKNPPVNVGDAGSTPASDDPLK